MLCENPARILNLNSLERISIHECSQELENLWVGKGNYRKRKIKFAAAFKRPPILFKSNGQAQWVSVDEMIKWSGLG